MAASTKRFADGPSVRSPLHSALEPISGALVSATRIDYPSVVSRAQGVPDQPV